MLFDGSDGVFDVLFDDVPKFAKSVRSIAEYGYEPPVWSLLPFMNYF
jgi:hypothetical protein